MQNDNDNDEILADLYEAAQINKVDEQKKNLVKMRTKEIYVCERDKGRTHQEALVSISKEVNKSL